MAIAIVPGYSNFTLNEDGTITIPGGIRIGTVGILLDATPLSVDGKFSGITETGTAGAALAFGQLCYFAVADSRWELAKADASATSAGKLGICVLAAAGDGSTTTILLLGKARADAQFPALTIGAPVYLSATTAGAITSTAPTGANFPRIVGYSNTADEIFFFPNDIVSVDDTAAGTDGATTKPISSNAFFDHNAATTGVHGVGAGTIAKTADITATKLDDFATPDANTDLNANTTNHGLLLQATAPAAGLYNYVGITNGETAYTNKALFDATAVTDSDAVSAGAVGTAATAARRDHVHKIDAAIADDAVLTVDDAAAADDDFARFTAAGIEGIPAQTALSTLLAQVLLENDSIKLGPAMSADGKWNGITVTGTAGAALAFGDAVYLAVADSRWEKTNATAAATSFGHIGICVLAAAGDGSATNILLWGVVRADTAFPAFTIGAPVFLSAATAGALTSTAPTGTTNFVVRIVGYARTADEILFCPDNTYLELA